MSDQLASRFPRLRPLGDSAWTVEFGNAIAPEIQARVLGFCRELADVVDAGGLPGVYEWVPAFCSATVHFDAESVDALALQARLSELAAATDSHQATGATWRIPVCFDAECAPDLLDVAAAKGLPTDKVVALLTESVFPVYMLGFLPGFPYLGGVPDALEMPRLAVPRKVVPSRSIAIAGRMCAAYPWESPGGWRLVGRTPIRLFDVTNERRPALLAPGDKVRWQAVDRSTFEKLDAECASGNFNIDSLRLKGITP